ncbi:hypothetical protein A7U60_g6277 [Sanghuangporus baumii]|uniref:CHAT domain-containing protein n=1 Tax=Sanghuangporus baumii TaxID=108892 RepID=A0A9Q5NAN4_SANBA|nr:hypothetical protein A7U60_g6277 [Sanghuangporus baumii]
MDTPFRSTNSDNSTRQCSLRSIVRHVLRLPTYGCLLLFKYIDYRRQTSLPWSRLKQHRSLEDLDSAITSPQVALDSLWTRYERCGEASDLDRTSMLGGVTLEPQSEAHPDVSESLNNTAYCLWERYQHRGRMEDLEEAINLHRAILQLRPEGHPDRPASLSDTANCLSTRYEHTGSMEDLEEAITLHHAVLDLLPEDHPKRSSSLNNTANCLWKRYEQRGRMEDLEEAITLHRAVLQLRPEGHPLRYHSLSNTASCLSTRYLHTGSMEDLAEAIALYRAALYLLPKGHPDPSSLLNNTASCLSLLYDHRGRMEDLEEAINLHRAALQLRPECHPLRSDSLNNTAACLSTRYDHGGRVEDLEEAIILYRAALDLLREGHPGRPTCLNNIATCLWTRCGRRGRTEDLEEAITLHCAALDLLPEGHPHRSTLLQNAAVCFQTRYTFRRRMEDLEVATTLNRTALELRPEGHPHRSASLSSIAIGLSTLYELRGRMEDLEEAITLHRDGLELEPGAHPCRSTSLYHLATCLLTRYKHKGTLEDLAEAITLHRAALELRPEGHTDRCISFRGLAACLYDRFLRERCTKDLEECIQVLNLAADQKFSNSPSRFEAARRWAEIARSHDHQSLFEAYKAAMPLLQRALTVRSTLPAQHRLLSSISHLHSLALDAASSAIDKDDFRQALEFLEQGRSLLWTQMRGFRIPLEQLSRADKTLSERFGDCNRRLEAIIASSDSPTTCSITGGDSIRALSTSQEKILADKKSVQMWQSYDEQEAIINDIRRIPGFENFLQAAPFEVIQQAASEGPVIVLNYSKYRCDALILLLQGCVCVPLDREFHTDAFTLHEEFLQVRQEFKVTSIEYDEILRRVMKFLWDRVVSKVVQKLKGLKIMEGSRIWWCPTSVLTAFPFHAAGPYEDANGNMKYLLDDYISSYIPTLTSLINARSGPQIGNERMLFVADNRLGCAEKEKDSITGIRRINKQLLDENATPGAVLRGLQKAPWVHFVCHGLVGEEPFNSSLELPGGRLTLLDIARANLSTAEFAFLSACSTAEQGAGHALDEALHLSAAMQFCGFRSVVGTMWELLDSDGPYLAGVVYGCLMLDLEDGEIRFKKAAAAVQEAALRLKEKGDFERNGNGVEMMAERWVNLVHIGA